MTTHAAIQTVVETVQKITFGESSKFENLSIVPILDLEERDAGYATLDEALAHGWAQVTEVSEAGQVSVLKVEVTGDVPVLLLDGEELIGAKQNRVLNLTILAPPRQTTVIPVSCVESGRWNRVSRGFAAAPRTQFAEGRAHKMRDVTASMQRSGSRISNQGAVWDRIADKSARMQALSKTSAMDAIYEKVEKSLEDFVGAFSPVEHQLGAMFFINGRPAGLELFDAAITWRKLSPKLVRSYAVDAIDHRQEQAVDVAPAPATFTAAVVSSPASVFPAAGEGDDVRISGTDVAGAALVARGRVIHVSAFPVTGA